MKSASPLPGRRVCCWRFQDYCFDEVRSILAYPGGFLATDSTEDTHWVAQLSGVAHHGGPVITKGLPGTIAYTLVQKNRVRANGCWPLKHSVVKNSGHNGCVSFLGRSNSFCGRSSDSPRCRSQMPTPGSALDQTTLLLTWITRKLPNKRRGPGNRHDFPGRRRSSTPAISTLL